MSSILKPSRRDVEKIFEDHEKYWGYLNKVLYLRCICDAKQIDLCNISEKDIYGVVKTFLVNWGGVLRNKKLKIDEYNNTVDKWAKNMPKIIKNNCHILKDFQKLKLESTSIEKYDKKIKKCYNDLKTIDNIGASSSSKILHLFAPDFFPMWDGAIIKEINKELPKSEYKIITGKITTSPQGYVNYMLIIQKLLKDYMSIWKSLSMKYDSLKSCPILRTVDIYLWMSCRIK